jgi:hypothetical protein
MGGRSGGLLLAGEIPELLPRRADLVAVEGLEEVPALLPLRHALQDVALGAELGRFVRRQIGQGARLRADQVAAGPVPRRAVALLGRGDLDDPPPVAEGDRLTQGCPVLPLGGLALRGRQR